MNKSTFFLAMLFFSLVKPVEGAAIKYFLVFGLVVAISVAFFLMIVRSGVWQNQWAEFRIEIATFLSLLCLYVFSVLLHFSVYANIFELLNYGVRTVVLYSILFMTWVIFSERSSSESISPALFAMIVLNVVAILQFFVYDSISWLTSSFVSESAMEFLEANPNLRDWGGVSTVVSLFRWHTIYGVVAGLCVLYSAGALLFSQTDRLQKVLFTALGVTAFLGGSLSESKNFIWTLSIGLLVILLKLPRKKKKIFMGLIIGVAFTFHIFAWFSPNLASQWGDALPYLEKIQQPSTIQFQDFVPTTNMLTGRDTLWKQAVLLWDEERWFGVGPGVYKLKSGFERRYNTHNLFLQTLVDTGLIGLALLALLLFFIAKRISDPVIFILFFSILASQLFDYFLDYSVGFVLIVAWLCSKPRLGLKEKERQSYS